jgi:hypothetical protein
MLTTVYVHRPEPWNHVHSQASSTSHLPPSIGPTMMSRKRRLSNTSQSSTSSPDPADPLHVSSDSTSIIDGSTSDGASSPTVRFTSPQSQNQNGVNGNHNHHTDDVVPPNKKRRRGGGPLKFQRSFEGMILGESNPPISGLEYPLHSNTPTSSWYAVPPQQPLPSYPADTLDCRDALAPDAEGDITISNDVDVLRPQSVEQPSSMKQETILHQPLGMEDDAMDEDQPNGRLRRGKSWYEPEKDRESLSFFFFFWFFFFWVWFGFVSKLLHYLFTVETAPSHTQTSSLNFQQVSS